MFCNHKWGKITEDGYQHCEKCNKARFSKVCDHVWETINELTQTVQDGWGSRQMYKIYIQKCKKCGEMTKYKF